MSTQQVLFAETIAGMKKAFKRKAYESDSDSEIEHYTNRGYKLKKRARFAHEGQLVPTNGPSSYRETVEYGGVQRAIIHRNPPLVDAEGYQVDTDDDDDERGHGAEAAAAELNPYANVHLEQILAPLAASTDLSTHPTLSKPFKSKTLTNLVDQSCDIMRKENRSLWQVRHLLTSLCGDYTWVPCEMMVRPSDVELYTDDHVARHLLSLSQGFAVPGGTPSPAAVNGESLRTNGVGGEISQSEQAGETQDSDKTITEDPDVSMVDADATELEGSDPRPGDEKKPGSSGENGGPDADANNAQRKTRQEAQEGGGVEGGKGEPQARGPNTEGQDPAMASGPAVGDESASGGRPAQEPVDRNGIQAAAPTSEGIDQTFVHPMFIAPVGAKPDRNVRLPEQEAEDIRRLLALYVQKQEEICRGTKKLYLGLLKADKLRKDVLHWSKAEAHSGPNRDMSDGEDWYDKEEWGLAEDLKKGQDEEEEDTQATGKKTRNRK